MSLSLPNSALGRTLPTATVIPMASVSLKESLAKATGNFPGGRPVKVCDTTSSVKFATPGSGHQIEKFNELTRKRESASTL